MQDKSGTDDKEIRREGKEADGSYQATGGEAREGTGAGAGGQARERGQGRDEDPVVPVSLVDDKRNESEQEKNDEKKNDEKIVKVEGIGLEEIELERVDQTKKDEADEEVEEEEQRPAEGLTRTMKGMSEEVPMIFIGVIPPPSDEQTPFNDLMDASREELRGSSIRPSALKGFNDEVENNREGEEGEEREERPSLEERTLGRESLIMDSSLSNSAVQSPDPSHASGNNEELSQCRSDEERYILARVSEMNQARKIHMPRLALRDETKGTRSRPRRAGFWKRLFQRLRRQEAVERETPEDDQSGADDEDLMVCVLCSDLLQTPVKLPCGDLSCLECALEASFVKRLVFCPRCSKKLTENVMSLADLRVEESIKKKIELAKTEYLLKIHKLKTPTSPPLQTRFRHFIRRRH